MDFPMLTPQWHNDYTFAAGKHDCFFYEYLQMLREQTGGYSSAL